MLVNFQEARRTSAEITSGKQFFVVEIVFFGLVGAWEWAESTAPPRGVCLRVKGSPRRQGCTRFFGRGEQTRSGTGQKQLFAKIMFFGLHFGCYRRCSGKSTRMLIRYVVELTSSRRPTSLTRSAGLLQELLNFSFEGETVSRLAQFDRDIDDCQKASGDRRYSAHVARTTETTPCPQQCSVDVVGISEGRDRQRQTRRGCCQLDTATNGSVSVWHAESGCLSEGQIALQRQGEGQRQTQRQCSDNAMLDLWQGWSFEERLLVQHPRWLEETNKPKGKNKGKDGKDKTPTNTPQQSHKDKKNVRCWNCNGWGTLLQRFSKEETELVGCGESRTTVLILWCDRRDNVEWFLLECPRGGGRAEQLGTQDCGCLGDGHRQWCSKNGGF